MIDKGICDTVLFGTLVIVNVSDKSCDISKYLNNENCKCRSKLTDKLVNKCSENTLVYNGTFNYQFVYGIHSIVCHMFHNKYKRYFFIYFHWYLKRRYNETTIY